MRLLITWLFVVGFALTGWAGSSAPKVFLRVHIQASDSDAPHLQVPIELANPREVIYVKKFAEVSEKDIMEAKLLPENRVLLVLSDRARNNLHTTTAQNQGKIMVVLLNQRVIYAPVIDVPLTSGRLVLPASFTSQEWQELQKLVRRNQRSG